MPRGKSTTKSVATNIKEKATVAKTTVANAEEEKTEATIKATENKVKTIKEEPLLDSDEIAVESLVPHVYYEDSRTGDSYEWDEVGHIEYMTFETLKNMWRNHKGYFRFMCLRPNDERVMSHFGVKAIFDKYARLMDSASYNKDNINDICQELSDSPSNLKITAFTRIKDMVANGEITDIYVVRTLERRFNLDLVSSL